MSEVNRAACVCGLPFTDESSTLNHWRQSYFVGICGRCGLCWYLYEATPGVYLRELPYECELIDWT